MLSQMVLNCLTTIFFLSLTVGILEHLLTENAGSRWGPRSGAWASKKADPGAGRGVHDALCAHLRLTDHHSRWPHPAAGGAVAAKMLAGCAG